MVEYSYFDATLRALASPGNFVSVGPMNYLKIVPQCRHPCEPRAQIEISRGRADPMGKPLAWRQGKAAETVGMAGRFVVTPPTDR